MASSTNSFFSIKVIRFLLKLVGFWYGKTEREEWVQFILRMNTIASLIFIFCIQVVDSYHSWNNFEELTSNFCVTFPFVIASFKLINFISRRNALIDIIIYSEENFWNRSYDKFGEKILKTCEKQSFSILCIMAIAVEGTAFSYVVRPIYDNIGKNETDRSLPLRVWTNFPVTKTPYYEIIFTTQTLFATIIGAYYFTFDCLLSTLNIHAIGQFKILRNRLENLCDDGIDKGELKPDDMYTTKIYEKLKQCMKHHLVLIEYVRKLENVFNLVLLCEVLLSSISICFSGFQLFIAKQTRFIFHFMSTLVNILVLTYTCDEITVQSSSVGDSVYFSKWYMIPTTKAGRSLHHGIIFVMIRSQYPCFLTAGKFARMSLDVFTAIFSTTLSYFSLLRRISEG